MATLEDIRQTVCDQSGHFELVADFVGEDYSDNGCDVLIQEAQRFLDRLVPRKREEKYEDFSLAIDADSANVEGVRFITRVETIDSNNATALLERKTWDWLVENYPDDEDWDSGVPEYWYVAPADVDATEVFSGVSIGIFPPTDAAITLRVYGAHYAKELTVGDDDAESWWSVEEPGILVDATRMVIERKLHRNTTGANDFEQDIRRRCQEIYYDLCAQEVQRPPSQLRIGMRGANE